MIFKGPGSWIKLYESSIYAKLTQNYGISNEVTREWLILNNPVAFQRLLIDKNKEKKQVNAVASMHKQKPHLQYITNMFGVIEQLKYINCHPAKSAAAN